MTCFIRTGRNLIFISVGMLICICGTFADIVKQKDRNSVLSQVRRRTIGTNDDKFCVIHVGPHKTGSTTLQGFLVTNEAERFKVALNKDNYEVPIFPSAPRVRKNHSELVKCLQGKGHGCSNTFNYFESFVNNAAENGSNILLSSETFDKQDVNMTKLSNFLVPEYKIHVVLYYRRYYDWIHSVYNQVTKNRKFKKRGLYTFVEWLTQGTFGRGTNIYSLATYNRYQKVPGVFNVSVVNMHEDPDHFNTLERFFCDHVDQAPELCKVAKSQEVEQSNPSQDLIWSIFQSRVQQYHSIRLSDEDERWPQIQRKFNKMTDIPQVCLPPEFKEKLLQISLETEIALTPKWWQNSDEGLENLKSDFEGKSKSKLCSLDIETILTSSEWQNFLTELEEDGIEDVS